MKNNKMKVLNAKGKTQKQIERQAKRWFAKNPNRQMIKVSTDTGVVTMFSSPIVLQKQKDKQDALDAKQEKVKVFKQKLIDKFGKFPSLNELKSLPEEELNFIYESSYSM